MHSLSAFLLQYGDDEHAYKVYGCFLKSLFPRKTFPKIVIIMLPDKTFVSVYFSILNHPLVLPQSINVFY